MIKYIGQHIFDFISRFRNDIYVVNKETGDEHKITTSTDNVDITVPSGSGTGIRFLRETQTDPVFDFNVGRAFLNIKDDTGGGNPSIGLTTGANIASGTTIDFTKGRISGGSIVAGQDDDVINTIRYRSYNDAVEVLTFAQVQAQIADASDTDEAGKYEIKVACSDGSTSSLQTAFSATGTTPHVGQAEIDVNIGHGEFSKTNIAGSMTIGGAQTSGDSFSITANSPTTSGQHGANFNIKGSDGNGVNSDGGILALYSGASTGTGEGGRILLYGTPPGTVSSSSTNSPSSSSFSFYVGNSTPYLTTGAQNLGFLAFVDFDTETFENTITAGGGSRHATVIRYAPAGTQSSLAAGQIYFLQTDGSWAQADASATSTGATQLLGVIHAGSVIPSKGIVLEGFIRIPSTEILNTPGSGAVDGLPVYVSTTAGHFDFTAPSGNNEYVRCVGYALDDHSGDVLVYFKPDNTFVKITA